MIAVPIQDLITKNTIKIAIENVMEVEKGNLITTDKELKSEEEDKVRTETQVILEVEVRLKNLLLQKTPAQGLRSEEFVLRIFRR